ncbi:F-box protein [Aspergillus candidus]|uniref:F-box domain-containing protein n=1 Tax=Aspergillus candidus TaxID=41067 RepID=A0A2I2F2G0_ASPCN|nr:hypothetical protein BDW47DRAFT_120053 [Aspergillus candidus]PLB34807.1 hypothetical protein BDW47DRAFT_120053 [Aspergillus candidus]
MPALATLPEEILLLIFDFADRASLKSLRFTCRHISTAATEKLFQKILLYPHDKSIQRFVSVANSDTHLFQLPRHIHFEPYQEGHYVIHDLDDPNAPNWGAVSSHLWKLPRVDSAMLHFRDNSNEAYDNQSDMGYHYLRSKIIDDFFAAVVEMVPTPRKLALGFIYETPVEDDHFARIRRVLGGLHTFRLGILYRVLPSRISMEIQSKWLRPTAASLQQLDLMFSAGQPAWSIFNLSDMHFPQLRSLTLRGCTFAAEAQLEWIVSHADTLQEMVLENCRILILVDIRGGSIAKASFKAVGMKLRRKSGYPNRKEGGYSARWKDVFALFGERMGQLRRFSMGWRKRGSDGWCEDTVPVRNVLHQCRYTSFCEWYDDHEEQMPYSTTGIGRFGRMGIHWSASEERTLASSQYQQDHEALVGLLRRIGDGGVID